mmetsp:Transcript_36734/g.105816  ORF Transcript_36734/g.105816 Transcript_36734/m.105816 type:complete len:687 (+) Transcript_36734:71-2131(+)
MSVLVSVQEEPFGDAASEASWAGASSVVAGTCMSVASSAVQSANTFGQVSALTAPPRYRSSGVFVHGTRFRNFRPIMQQGLKAAQSEIFMIDEVRADGRVPGLKAPPEILIFIDEGKARCENMEFEYVASQGIWKTKGIGGVIRPWFFQKVVDQRRGPGRGNVLFQSKEDPMMEANLIRGVQRPRYLLHATYWGNIFGIMSEGILPARNPTGTAREPFRALLQGAESHVYTVSCENDLGQIPRRSARGIVRQSSAPEVRPEERGRGHRKVDEHEVGLETPPDAFLVIDTKRAEDFGLELDLVQSVDREDVIYVRGAVPREAIARVEANDPICLPDCLKAKIVDPKSFEDIPIIDLRLDDATVVKQLRYACEVVGFMQVVGHGVSEELQDRHMELQKRFFQLPDAVKQRLALNEACPVRGYFGRGGEDLDQVLDQKLDDAPRLRARTDNKEALDTNGVPWSRPRGGFVAEIFGKASRLPEEAELEGFRETIEEYSAEMFALARRLLSLFARVLDQPPDLFERHLTAPVATHRLLHYWPIDDFSKQIGVGEHTDYGLLTILKQDSVGGLQVLNAKELRWVHCCPVRNAFVVNLGDMLARWTGHRFRSTIHRVVNASAEERFSVPYFLEPNMDTVIATGGLCDPALDLPAPADDPTTAEDLLERFYRASGQLKVVQARGASTCVPGAGS